jgi:hypothetical protein
MSEFRVDQITNQAGTAGPDIAGITTFSSTSGMLMPSGVTEYRGGRGRGLFGGGFPTTNLIDYITISTTSNASDFGDLTVSRFSSGCSSSTRGLFGGGGPSTTNTIDYVTISSTGNAFDFGDLTLARQLTGACSSSTRGIWAGGAGVAATPTFQLSTIDYVTISTLGNSSYFGDLTLKRRRLASCSSPVRGIFSGGQDNPLITLTNIIDYITIASAGNAIDFGDLIVSTSSLSGCSNPTRGLFGGGYSPTTTNTINYITISTTGNAIDFGDLTADKNALGAVSSSTRGVFAGGYNFPTSPITTFNTIDFVTISSTGNATTFGNLFFTGRYLTAGCSDAHGGLGD